MYNTVGYLAKPIEYRSSEMFHYGVRYFFRSYSGLLRPQYLHMAV
ncbi:hypothetical protein OOU_Y34scaffold00711g12 [Pyricularia oryzae Y34]|uniref:Uncharacterized protein n=2 Tax=Pyricularia oryzae TaxID=318829 RepID=A0AA97PI31_PYRO3|nr:hypothetical protein OOU_Y34scaffold00711g12 [Pyricularia oryzae Y34]